MLCAVQLSAARVRLEALTPERCLPALLSGAYARLASLEVTGVEHWPARSGCTALLAALTPAALPELSSLTLRGAPEFGVVPSGARPDGMRGLGVQGFGACSRPPRCPRSAHSRRAARLDSARRPLVRT